MVETQPAGIGTAPPDCAICERSLLVGESLCTYRSRDDQLLRVCELCRDRARHRGLEPVGAVSTPRLRVQPSGTVEDIMDRERLIEGLGEELEYLKRELGAAHLALNEQNLQEGAVLAVTDRLRRQERELERLRREADPVRRAEEQRMLQAQAAELRELRAGIRVRDEEIARLKLARDSETDPRRMCRFALDAFNSSEHADRMARIARTLGEPEVCVDDEGPGLPRKVKITLVWDIAWYQFLVKLDLGVGRASVHDVANGGDASSLPEQERTANARWRESGLVLI